jgi:hypothetical protein
MIVRNVSCAVGIACTVQCPAVAQGAGMSPAASPRTRHIDRPPRVRGNVTSASRRGQRVIVAFALGLLSGAAVGCAKTWQLNVAAGVEPVVVRVVTEEGETSWLVRGQATLLRLSSVPQGEVQLMNPETCATYDRVPIPRDSAVLIVVSDGGEPPRYGLVVEVGYVSETTVKDPDFVDC